MTTRNAVLLTRLHAVERRNHPWIYSSAVAIPEGVRTGDVVEVESASGAFVGRGLADAESAIAIRLWTRDKAEAIDESLIARRVKMAWKLRQAILRGQDTDAYRLLHGEADFTPGVVCDVYGSYAVLQADGRAAETLLPAFGRAVGSILPHVRCVVIKARGKGGRDGDDSSVSGGTLLTVVGDSPGAPFTVREHGMRFLVDIERGHKTGAYLDQRESRCLVREFATGRSVLNLFAYTGGFSVAAMLGGASGVTSVDLSQPAIDAARANFRLNAFDPNDQRIAFAACDALEFMRRDTQRYGMVILDPPSLAHSMSQLPTALAAYRRLNEAALGRVAPGGVLVSGSCTRRVTAADLERIVVDASHSVGRTLQVVRRTGAAPDHPVIKSFPEGDYLTMIWAEVSR